MLLRDGRLIGCSIVSNSSFSKILKNYGETETLQVIAWKGFSKKDPFASELLSNMKFTDEQISSLMTAMNETETNEDDAALKWMNENRQLINSWIPQTDAIR